jgi:hypothetical protein
MVSLYYCCCHHFFCKCVAYAVELLHEVFVHVTIDVCILEVACVSLLGGTEAPPDICTFCAWLYPPFMVQW